MLFDLIIIIKQKIEGIEFELHEKRLYIILHYRIVSIWKETST